MSRPVPTDFYEIVRRTPAHTRRWWGLLIRLDRCLAEAEEACQAVVDAGAKGLDREDKSSELDPEEVAHWRYNIWIHRGCLASLTPGQFLLEWVNEDGSLVGDEEEEDDGPAPTVVVNRVVRDV